MYWGVGPPKTGAGLGGGLLTLDSLVHLPSGREDWRVAQALGLGEEFKPEQGSEEPEWNQPGIEQRLAPRE